MPFLQDGPTKNVFFAEVERQLQSVGLDVHESALLATRQDDDSTIHRQTGTRAALQALVDSAISMGPRSSWSLLKVLKTAALGDAIDDRKNLMEDMMEAVTKDNDHRVSEQFTRLFVKELWGDLEHPPTALLTEEHQFRKADGSGNNLLFPKIGAAGQPYARSVKPASGPSAVYPDPEVIFEELLQARDDKRKPHPGGISSILPYLAIIITHDLFRTSRIDSNISTTSSYLDLAPLYGSNERELARVRSFQDGKLKPDCFSEVRLLALPPGPCIILIMFNRFHNNVAEQLAAINENGRFNMPKKLQPMPQFPDLDTQEKVDRLYADELKKREERLFQTARLVTGGLYINIILVDYVRTILNLNRTDNNWQLNPRLDLPDGPQPGVGNQVSVEFNLVYRWHGVISERDAKWAEARFQGLMQTQTPGVNPMPGFLRRLGGIEDKLSWTHPMDREIPSLKRQADGYYKDEDLAQSLAESIDDAACAFGPRQVPAVFKAVEVLGLEQARSWRLASLNEFRQHFNLVPYKTFAEITNNPEVAFALEKLYKEPDNVELSVGMAVEDYKEPRVPGSGLCPGYTAGRAILADATCLVRGDRFYTASYHPKNLTNWGFGAVDWDTEVDNGCSFYRLFQTALPHQFHPDSVYSHYPLTLTKEMQAAFKNGQRPDMARKAHKYDMCRPDIGVDKSPFVLRSAKAASALLEDPNASRLDLSFAIALLLQDERHEKGFDNHIRAVQGFFSTSPLEGIANVSKMMLAEACEDLGNFVRLRLDEKAYKLASFQQVDIVADVVRGATANFAAKLLFPFNKFKYNADHSWPDLFDAIAATWSNFDEPTLTEIRQKTASNAHDLRKSLKPLLVQAEKNAKVDHMHRPSQGHAMDDLREQVLCNAFKQSNLNTDQTFAVLAILAADLATSLNRLFSELLNQLLAKDVTGNDKNHLGWLRKALKDDANGPEEVAHYTRELLRLSSEAVTTRILTTDFSPPGSGVSSLKRGQRILLSSRILCARSAELPAAAELQLDRNASDYLPLDLAVGVNDTTWQALHLEGVTTMLGIVIGSLTGLRPAKIWDGIRKDATLKKIPVVMQRPAWEKIPASEMPPPPPVGPSEKPKLNQWTKTFDDEEDADVPDDPQGTQKVAAKNGDGHARAGAIQPQPLPPGIGSGSSSKANDAWGGSSASSAIQPQPLPPGISTSTSISPQPVPPAAPTIQPQPLPPGVAGANEAPCSWRAVKTSKVEREKQEEEVAQMVYLNDKWNGFVPFPTNLLVNWDASTVAA